MRFHSEREETEHSREMPGQSKMDDQQVNPQTLHLHVWCQSALQNTKSFQALLTATDFSCAGSAPVSLSPWHVGHDSVIFVILGSGKKSSLHPHSFTQWPFWASMQGRPDTHLASAAVLTEKETAHPLLVCLTLNLAQHGQSWQVFLLLRLERGLSVKYNVISFLYLIVSVIA